MLTKGLVDDVRANTIVFFASSIVAVLVCCVVFHVTRRTDFVKFYVTRCQTSSVSDDRRAIINEATNAEEVSLVSLKQRNAVGKSDPRENPA